MAQVAESIIFISPVISGQNLEEALGPVSVTQVEVKDDYLELNSAASSCQ